MKNKIFGLLTGIYYPVREFFRRVGYYLGDRLARLVVRAVILIFATVTIIVKLIKLTKKFTRKSKKGEKESS